MVGHGTVKRAYKLCTAYMNVRIEAKNGDQCITNYQYLSNYYGGQCRPNDIIYNENEYELKSNYVSTKFPGKTITNSPTWAAIIAIIDNTISKNKYRCLCLIITKASFNLIIKAILYTNRKEKGIKNRASLRSKCYEGNKHATNYTSLSKNIDKGKYVRNQEETAARRLISLVNVIRIESTNCILFHTICLKYKKGRGLVTIYGVCRRSVLKIKSCNSNKERFYEPTLNAVIL